MHALAQACGKDDNLKRLGGHAGAVRRRKAKTKRAGSTDPARMCCASKSRSFVIPPLHQAKAPGWGPVALAEPLRRNTGCILAQGGRTAARR
jgi:hypothetical protein